MKNQISLKLTFKQDYSSQSFILSKCNIEAKNLIHTWPSKTIQNNVSCIFGPAGCGKTHLANIWANNNKAIFIEKLDENIFYKNSIKKFVLEDLNILENFSEVDLFHLFNIVKETKSYILLTSNIHPSKILWKLKDLRSRVNASFCVSIDSPDEILIKKLMKKLFEDRQLFISDDLIDFSLKRIERSFKSVYKFVQIIDNASLSNNKPLTRSLIKDFLNF